MMKFAIVSLWIALSSTAHASWKMTFSDEFNGTQLDNSKWTPTYRWGDRSLSSNGESQCYMEDNISFVNGFMVFTAKKESIRCAKPAKTYSYTSGAVGSFDKFHQAYGYFEMRARLPKGQGLWPAFWLIPQSGNWPPEIDIMEVLAHQPTRAYQTLHYDSGGHKQSAGYKDVADLSVGYHTFGVDWQPGKLTWYIDGVQVRTLSSSFVPNEPMYILANLAVGGYWPGQPNATTPFPSSMAIDYIRVYERINDGQDDRVPPFGGGTLSVKNTYPSANAVLNPKTYVTLSVSASNAVKVAYYINDVSHCVSTTKPFNCSFYTGTTGRKITVRAVAYNSAGKTASSSVSATISAPVTAAAPSIALLSPTNGAKIAKSFWTTLSSTTKNTVSVTYSVNGKQVCVVTKAPFNCSYQTPSTVGTKLTVQAVAKNSAGKTATTSVVVTTK